MIRIFRLIALFEGLTNLALFLVAMPLKYVVGNPILVSPVGMIHGWVWIVYMRAMVIALWGRNVGVARWVRAVLAGLVPFGTFLNDRYVRPLTAAR